MVTVNVGAGQGQGELIGEHQQGDHLNPVGEARDHIQAAQLAELIGGNGNDVNGSGHAPRSHGGLSPDGNTP